MRRLKGVLLDLDGTLANTEDYNISYSQNKPETELLEYKLYKFLLPVLKVIEWEEFKGLYLRARKEIKQELSGTAASHNRYLVIQRTLELCGVNFVPEIIQRAFDFYFAEMLERTTLFPGVLEVLRCMKYNQLKTCLVTDFTADVQIKKIRKLGLTKYIDYMVTSEEAGADKPHVEQAIVALKKMHLSQDEVIMIGNNPKTDIDLATRIEMRSILFDYSGQYKNVTTSATHYITDFHEVSKLLNLKVPSFSRKNLLVIDFIGTLTNEKHIVDEVLHTFVHKEASFVRAEYELFQKGQITEAQFWYKVGVGEQEKARKSIEAAITIRQSVVRLLERLKKEFTLVLVSDFPAPWGTRLLEKRGVSQLFDKILFSSSEGIQKPNTLVYEQLLALYPEVNPERITLVDNNLMALSTGRDLLMRTVFVNNRTDRNSVFAPDDVVKDVLDIEGILHRKEKINQ